MARVKLAVPVTSQKKKKPIRIKVRYSLRPREPLTDKELAVLFETIKNEKKTMVRF